MRIVLAHKFFHMIGGTEQYFRNLSSILTDHGHQTIPFAMKHPDDRETPYSKYFVENLDYNNPSDFYLLRNLPRILTRTLYSWEARHKIETLIRDTNPDIAHLQSIEHHISPSIIHSLCKYDVPIVHSINTYKHICASYRLFDHGEICERCLYGKHYHAVLRKCLKGSVAASLLAMIEMYLHEWLRIYHLVDRFIVPNRFIESKLVDAGYPSNKIVRLRNPLDLKDYSPNYEFDDYILYFGRIAPEKGVLTLVQAMKQIPDMRLVIVGDGTQFDEIQKWIRIKQASNVEMVGAKWGTALTPYLSQARLVVVPSIWYEPSPMVIYQALATGKPVIGSNIGGIPDLLTEETGVLFEPGNVEDLTDKILALVFDDQKLRSMGRAARQWAEANLDPEVYYDTIIHLYADLI